MKLLSNSIQKFSLLIRYWASLFILVLGVAACVGEEDDMEDSDDAAAILAVEAEDYDTDDLGETPDVENGIRAVENEENSGGAKVGFTANGAWLRYSTVDFGEGYDVLSVSVASPDEGAQIAFRVGSESGVTLATVDVPVTGSFVDFQTVEVEMDLYQGVDDLYLVIIQSRVDIDWFRLGGGEPVSTPEPTPTIVPTVVPTLSPSVSPTAVPTIAPTQPPTPTVAPTPTSTPVPTATPTPPPSGSSCSDLEAEFDNTIYGVLQGSCSGCHVGPGAFGGELLLTNGGGAADFAIFRAVTNKQEGGKSVMLGKPLGEMNHVGGAVLSADDPDYQLIEQFVPDVETCTE